jgi:hypothetical protein
MTDEQKTTQEKCCAPSEDMPFAAVMEKILGQQDEGCDCIEMMSQMMEQPGEVCPCIAMISNDTDQAETSSECSSMLSQIMGACCGSQARTEMGSQTA